MTSLSNPKSALLVASLFAAALPPGAPLATGLVTVAEMVAISLAWYGLIACLISAPPVAALFRRARRWIDRAAGAIFLAFAARLAIATLLDRP
jgi:threonine/homoserine/homoserine lactone efflux protein